jgi:hypothetical protein
LRQTLASNPKNKSKAEELHSEKQNCLHQKAAQLIAIDFRFPPIFSLLFRAIQQAGKQQV